MLRRNHFKLGCVFAPSISKDLRQMLTPNEYYLWVYLCEDYNSFANQAEKAYTNKRTKYNNVLTCYNKTNETIAEEVGFSYRNTVRLMTSLVSKGVLVRIPFGDNKGNRRRNLVVVDPSLADAEAILQSCADILHSKSINSNARGGGESGKSLAILHKYIPEYINALPDKGGDDVSNEWQINTPVLNHKLNVKLIPRATKAIHNVDDEVWDGEEGCRVIKQPKDRGQDPDDLW